MTLDDFLNGSWTIRDLRAGRFRDCIDLYTARLRKDGYSTVTARYSVRIVNCFIRWLIERHFDRADINEQLVVRFFEDKDRGCGLRDGDPAAIGRFMEVLREAKIVAPALPLPPSPSEQLLERFRAYLDHRHGLNARSCAAYVKFTRPFLRNMSITGPGDCARLTTTDILGYVERRARDGSAATAVAMCSRLRSFLRYLQVEGLIANDLAACVPSLPPDVGAAIAAYLQSGRPVSDRRQLFLRTHPPHFGFPPTSGIRDIASRALKPAGISGIAHRGSHIFRHSLATELLRSGAALTQISQVLRHKDHDTTRIYAKVDLASLRTLSLPWPGDVQ